jgi:hypothetical protein
MKKIKIIQKILINFILIFVIFFVISQKNVQAQAIWEYEGSVFYALPDASSHSEGIPIYRFWSALKQSHFYTASLDEKNYVEATWPDIWQYEGIVYYAFSESVDGATPLYRFWSDTKQSHFYTSNLEEKNYVEANWSDIWQYEGIAYYVYNTTKAYNTDVYRFWSPSKQSHFYTASAEERDYIIETWGGNELGLAEFGPQITAGILTYDKDYSKDNSIEISSDQAYFIKDKNKNPIAAVPAGSVTKVKYDGGGKLKVYNSIDDRYLDEDVYFESVEGNILNSLFEVEPLEHDKYRGFIQIHYESNFDEVYAINILRLEQLVWGMGEIDGDDDEEHNKAMTTAYRTYAYKILEDGDNYEDKEFHVNANKQNEIYYGYDWETDHEEIREAAEVTKGEIIVDDDEDPIWSIYTKSTDGNTKSWEEVWGDDDYPYCKSVPDPWGEEENAASIPGNHMVGLSIKGSSVLADEESKDYDEIIEYYYDDVDIKYVY